MVTGSRNGKIGVRIHSGKYDIISDVPIELGGEDMGPSPHRLLEASLVACTVITVQMYANHNGWPLDGTDVEVDIKSEGREQSVISRRMAFRGELTAEQKERLFQIAEKCPIHNLLQSHIAVESSLVEKI